MTSVEFLATSFNGTFHDSSVETSSNGTTFTDKSITCELTDIDTITASDVNISEKRVTTTVTTTQNIESGHITNNTTNNTNMQRAHSHFATHTVVLGEDGPRGPEQHARRVRGQDSLRTVRVLSVPGAWARASGICGPHSGSHCSCTGTARFRVGMHLSSTNLKIFIFLLHFSLRGSCFVSCTVVVLDFLF